MIKGFTMLTLFHLNLGGMCASKCAQGIEGRYKTIQCFFVFEALCKQEGSREICRQQIYETKKQSQKGKTRIERKYKREKQKGKKERKIQQKDQKIDNQKTTKR